MMPIHIQHVPKKLELIIFPSQKPPVARLVNIRDSPDPRLPRWLGRKLARSQQNGRRGQQFCAHRPIRSRASITIITVSIAMITIRALRAGAGVPRRRTPVTNELVGLGHGMLHHGLDLGLDVLVEGDFIRHSLHVRSEVQRVREGAVDQDEADDARVVKRVVGRYARDLQGN
jgi:hypothetical protein